MTIFMKNIEFAKHEIVKIGQRLHQKNMLAAADGNISLKISDEIILISPSGVSKGYIQAEQIATITINNEIISGHPSSERLMHLEIYKNCSEAKVVIHAHPPTAIAWSIARPELKKLPSDCLSEVILACGEIPIVPYARPGTIEMGTVIKNFLPQYKAMILARHGALTWASDLEEAYRGMERIENSAEILAKAFALGGLHPLPKEEIEYLYELRKKIGNVLL